MTSMPDDPPVAIASVLVDIDVLRDSLTEAFATVGCASEEASLITDALLQAELCEVPTHGLFRVPGYLDGFASGRYKPAADVRVVHRGPASVLIDADNALGYWPAWLALEEAVTIATEFGVGLAGVRNSNELGRAAYYVEAAAARGFVSMICANTRPLLGAPGATFATHGNNPLAYSAPWPDAPLFDAAWTPRSGGEIARRRLLGLPLLAEWGYRDELGRPTTDPAAATLGVMPAVGGAKGFGIAILVDLLAGVLTGAANGPAVPLDNSGVGAFVIVLGPDVFGDSSTLSEQLGEAARAVRSSGGRWPGDRSHAARASNLRNHAVSVPKAVLDRAVKSIRRSAPSAASRLEVCQPQAAT